MLSLDNMGFLLAHNRYRGVKITTFDEDKRKILELK